MLFRTLVVAGCVARASVNFVFTKHWEERLKAFVGVEANGEVGGRFVVVGASCCG